MHLCITDYHLLSQMHIQTYIHKNKINLARHLQIVWCQAPPGADGTKTERERERRGERDRRWREEQLKRGLWHLFFSAHTKAAYYLILHTMDRGMGMVRKAEKPRHTVGCQKGGSKRHHCQSGVLLAVTQGIIVLKEWWNCFLSLSVSAKPDSAQPRQPSKSLEI